MTGVSIDRTEFGDADLTGLDPEDARTVRPWAPHAQFDAETTRMQRPGPAELRRRLEDHARWLETEGREGKQAVFEEVDFSARDFAGQRLAMVAFRRCNLLGATFAGAMLYSVDFSRSDLRHVSFREALVLGCRLDESSLFQADFQGARIGAVDLVGGRKLLTSFCRSTVTHAKFAGAMLRDVDLRDTAFAQAGLPGARLGRLVSDAG